MSYNDEEIAFLTKIGQIKETPKVTTPKKEEEK